MNGRKMSPVVNQTKKEKHTPPTESGTNSMCHVPKDTPTSSVPQSKKDNPRSTLVLSSDPNNVFYPIFVPDFKPFLPISFYAMGLQNQATG